MREIISFIDGEPFSAAGTAERLPIENPADETRTGTLFEADKATVNAARSSQSKCTAPLFEADKATVNAALYRWYRAHHHLFEADKATVNAAVSAARQAFDSGPWPRMSASERQAILLNAARVLGTRADELAELECEDAGLSMHEIRARHIPRMQKNFEYAAALSMTDTGDVLEQNKDYLTIVNHEPAGVAALLAPWNAPLGLASMKLMQAICLGNTAVLKPSEHTPPRRSTDWLNYCMKPECHRA